MRPLVHFTCGLVLLAFSAKASAQPLFAGDPIDPMTGKAYAVLPGLPLVYPGADGRYGTADDLVDTSIVGDIDVALRTGGTFAGASIPPTSAGIAAAPTVIAGGLHGGAGTRAEVQIIATDGALPPLGGHPLLGADLDLRRALVVAYPDLDGDGFVGPTRNAPADAVQIQRQEALTFAGRAMAEVRSGVAACRLGVTMGAPASMGGLGIAVGAGMATGATPNLFADGPWAATSLPYMIPLDQARIVGGEPTGPVDPVGLVDLELSGSGVYLPSVDDPILGGAFAMALDGSDASIDLLRAESGPPAGVGFAIPVDPRAFVAAWGRVIHVLPDGAQGRLLVEPVESLAVPASGLQEVSVYPADLVGNGADAPPDGLVVSLEAGAGVRILAPDADADPSRESISFASAAPVVVSLAFQPATTGAGSQVLALLDGVPAGMLALSGGSAGPISTPVSTPISTPVATAIATSTSTSIPVAMPTQTPPATPAGQGAVRVASVKLHDAKRIGKDSIKLTVDFEAPSSFDPGVDALAIEVRNGAAALYAKTFAAGSFTAKRSANRFRFADASVHATLVRKVRRAGGWTLTLRAVGLALDGTLSSIAAADLRVAPGAFVDLASLPCKSDPRRKVTLCAR